MIKLWFRFQDAWRVIRIRRWCVVDVADNRVAFNGSHRQCRKFMDTSAGSVYILLPCKELSEYLAEFGWW